MSGLKARKGEFTGTQGNEAKIDKRISKNQSVNISAPTSYRTTENDGSESIGLTSGEAKIVNSSAIDSARYDPTDDSLNITYKGGKKEYKFRAGGPEGIREWINADSKGRKTQEWRTSHRFPGY